ALLARLRRREVRTRLRGEIAREGLNNFGRIPSWDEVRVAVAPRLPEEAGHTFGDIAHRRRVEPFDAVCDFVIEDRGETRILVTSMSDKDVHAISATPWVTVGSDANALATSGITSQGKPHPRSYGTHARLLGPFVRDLRLLTLPAPITPARCRAASYAARRTRARRRHLRQGLSARRGGRARADHAANAARNRFPISVPCRRRQSSEGMRTGRRARTPRASTRAPPRVGCAIATQGRARPRGARPSRRLPRRFARSVCSSVVPSYFVSGWGGRGNSPGASLPSRS